VREVATGFLKLIAYQNPATTRNAERGGVMTTHNDPLPEQQGFSTGDILWALGVWSVILSLSPVVVFYMLMVN
jgi:hypothetical protein